MFDSAPSSFAEFEMLAGAHRFVPVWMRASCGDVPLVDVFEAMSPDGRGFILDGTSPEPGASRHAYVGIGTQRALGPREVDNRNPFEALRESLSEIGSAAGVALHPFFSSAVGYFAYEAVRHLEPSVAPLRPDPIGVPEAAFIYPAETIALDRVAATATAVVTADVSGGNLRTAYDYAIGRCRELLVLVGNAEADRQLQQSTPLPNPLPQGERGRRSSRSVVSRAEYERRVESARRAIIGGELIQVVLSQRFERPTDARPLDVYRELTRLNPSTYMFYLGFGQTASAPTGFHLVGASPELMTRVRGGVVSVHPIAGTRLRSPDDGHDERAESELLGSEKERAEHIMLVDLARNDLGRVCESGTVEVPYLMRTERYSHVMHLVSRVRGRLRGDCDGVSAFEAGFPIGTLAGAPKIRAMQLIAELESEGRGPYCGGVGWFAANGDLDTGTVIRSIVFKDGVAHIQGGGGIVFDSDPSAEYQESLHKIQAPLEAIAAAENRGAADLTGHRWRSPQVVNA